MSGWIDLLAVERFGLVTLILGFPVSVALVLVVILFIVSLGEWFSE